ncbi:nucleotidyl transferase AbiEii/AbiGii toxin family protein [Collinsella sp. AGMB00827]|uniref:Nucleotidyl transferase AbiEii/AbiGii toxin family protein n=1 Tax=Collinsella ureilytica TaxID=2869515 RepID=A0ABS7MHV9_9ACTN|nr:nucleotidyl transferase AbiEii/AbiGii toxin family protein [Collinsella urealyticum]MBY4796924.1 nucleotidyl transferase AbiEii/AbiGii toxin family protein [Collinsella urealyticum]
MKRPNSLRHLDDAIRRLSKGNPQRYIHIRTILANAIVANLLPDGVIKGGSALKMRFGDADTRFTTDVDTATATVPSRYIARLNEALSSGWEGFTGRVVPKEPAAPKGIPQPYVMLPYDIKLSYLGKSWCTVPLEVGHNEIGDTDAVDWVYLEDATELFRSIGFPSPGKAPLMLLDHQIAQKIHAISGSDERVRDLIDLQLICTRADVDLMQVRKTCERLFAYRQAQSWPPTIIKQQGWIELYQELARDLPVVQNIDQAIEWINSLIESIQHAQ